MGTIDRRLFLIGWACSLNTGFLGLMELRAAILRASRSSSSPSDSAGGFSRGGSGWRSDSAEVAAGDVAVDIWKNGVIAL